MHKNLWWEKPELSESVSVEVMIPLFQWNGNRYGVCGSEAVSIYGRRQRRGCLCTRSPPVPATDAAPVDTNPESVGISFCGVFIWNTCGASPSMVESAEKVGICHRPWCHVSFLLIQNCGGVEQWLKLNHPPPSTPDDIRFMWPARLLSLISATFFVKKCKFNTTVSKRMRKTKRKVISHNFWQALIQEQAFASDCDSYKYRAHPRNKMLCIFQCSQIQYNASIH